MSIDPLEYQICDKKYRNFLGVHKYVRYYQICRLQVGTHNVIINATVLTLRISQFAQLLSLKKKVLCAYKFSFCFDRI